MIGKAKLMLFGAVVAVWLVLGSRLFVRFVQF